MIVKEKIKRASLWLVTATFVISLVAVGLHSCNKEDSKRSLGITFTNESISLDYLSQYMSQIYFNVHHEQQFFDSCKVVEQFNGYTIVVGMGTNKEDKPIKFAAIADKNGEVILLRDTPPSTCICERTCTSGCNPYYIGNGHGWDCTGCEPSQSTATECIKTETPNQPHPGGGNQ